MLASSSVNLKHLIMGLSMYIESYFTLSLSRFNADIETFE